MARKKQALTPALIANLTKGSIADALTPGLALAISGKGKKVWKYYRRLPGARGLLKQTLGQFPAFSIADARNWAKDFNDQIDAGIDPRDARRTQEAEQRAKEERATMTVARAHRLHIDAVR